MRDLSLPWRVEYVENDWFLPNGTLPWLILDRWGVVIARFDREDQADAAVCGANQKVRNDT